VKTVFSLLVILLLQQKESGRRWIRIPLRVYKRTGRWCRLLRLLRGSFACTHRTSKAKEETENEEREGDGDDASMGAEMGEEEDAMFLRTIVRVIVPFSEKREEDQ
jgi:hypothetical protein